MLGVGRIYHVTGQPSAEIPLAVGQEARGQPSTRHHRGGAQQDRHVYETDPSLAGKRFACHPYEERGDGAAEEEPVNVRVNAEVPEYPAWPHQSPHHGGVVENVIHRTLPLTVSR
nr:hypothetical protein Itr_chr05CG24230 [Ipomoea trifida]